MCDETVRTRIETPEGWRGLQEYLVREHAEEICCLDADLLGSHLNPQQIRLFTEKPNRKRWIWSRC